MCYLVLSCHCHPRLARDLFVLLLWSNKLVEDVGKKTDESLEVKMGATDIVYSATLTMHPIKDARGVDWVNRLKSAVLTWFGGCGCASLSSVDYPANMTNGKMKKRAVTDFREQSGV